MLFIDARWFFLAFQKLLATLRPSNQQWQNESVTLQRAHLWQVALHNFYSEKHFPNISTVIFILYEICPFALKVGWLTRTTSCSAESSQRSATMLPFTYLLTYLLTQLSHLLPCFARSTTQVLTDMQTTFQV